MVTLLQRPLRILYDACRQTGRDGGGANCPECVLRDMCDRQLVRNGRSREPSPRYRPGEA